VSEVVGEAVIVVRTDSTGVNPQAEGQKAGGSYARGFVTNLRRIAVGIGAVLAIRETIQFAKDAVAEGREAQKVGAATTQLIRTTGSAANVTAADVARLTGAMSTKIGVDDEAIQSAANLVLAFKNVRNEAGKGNDVFDRTIRAGQDLAAAGFGSANSASKALAKALDDPAKGMAALTRLGVRLTDQQTKQVQAFIKSGDTLSAQKFLLDQVEGKVGGVAAATATAGERSSVAWLNVKEAVGTALLPALDSAENAFANKVAPAMIGVLTGSSRLGKGVRFVGREIREGFGIAERAIHPLLDAAGRLAKAALPEVKAQVKELIPPIRDLAKKLGDDVMTAAENLSPIILPLVKEAAKLARSFRLEQLKVVGTVLSKIGDVLVSVTGFLGDHDEAVRAVVVGILAMVAAFKVYQGILAVIRAVTIAYTAVQAALNVVMSANPIALVVIALVGLAAGLIYAYKHSEKFRAVVDSVFGFIKSAIPDAIGFVVDFVKEHWGLLVTLILGPLGFVLVQVIKHWDGIKSAIGSAISWVVDKARDFDEFRHRVISKVGAIVIYFAKLPGRLRNAIVGKMADIGKALIEDFFKGMNAASDFVGDLASTIKNAVLGVVNDVIDLLNKGIPDKLSIPGAPDINLPNNPIPRLARGTSNWRGGWSWVGEEGPELLRLPGGSQVVPHRESVAAAGGAGGPTIVIGQMMPHNYGEWERQMSERHRAASLGGPAAPIPVGVG
jgi:hypothetical protein